MPTNPNPLLRHVDDVTVPRRWFPRVPLANMPRTHTTFEQVTTCEKCGLNERSHASLEAYLADPHEPAFVTKAVPRTTAISRAVRRLMQRDFNRQIRRAIRYPRTAMGPHPAS